MLEGIHKEYVRYYDAFVRTTRGRMSSAARGREHSRHIMAPLHRRRKDVQGLQKA